MANLKWVVLNTFTKEYSLTDENNNPQGSLTFRDITKTIAQANSGPFHWTFGRSGITKPRIEVRTVEELPQNVATLELGLFGDSIFTVGGIIYRWNREWVLSADWMFRNNQGQDLMTFSPSKSPDNFFVKVKTQPAADSLTERDKVLMEMLGFYVLIVIKEFD